MTPQAKTSGWRLLAWPFHLSVDIALGAVVTGYWAAHLLGTRLSLGTLATLAIAVLAVYSADHLRDAQSLNTQSDAAIGPRHRFYVKHQKLFAALLGLYVLMGAALAICFLPKVLLLGGLGVGSLAALYLLRQSGAGKGFGYGKEILGAGLYAAGVWLPAVTMHANPRLPWGYILFLAPATALIAFSNLVLMAHLDCDNDHAAGFGSLPQRLGTTQIRWLGISTAVMAMAMVASGWFVGNGLGIDTRLPALGVFMAMAVLMLSCWLLEKPLAHKLPHASPGVLRVAADSVFWLPGLVLMIFGGI